ncbi:hypothetical protein FC65_GL001466 [Ligilactobacillus acidipiscis DSM 15836]|uniref:Uncharacterized protein n=1 Tax=Ligilactobacillus acidipiscis DSM 15836 TaxID=1423716 RepID=A0ABR5PM84_9LACO|nr:hypothetical protein [Ligilactobacillus acidipiscis]KRM29074.1 hypothetical protein FC65_GL001466 [Ligilactobacillus acidipiscis DSM 15836]GAW64095.1 hypothetical protein Lacidipiscis_01286 [Ligilactobacillus acidipiscis]GEN20982.1 hypothetical protein LAC02_42630 [Ligilactobacillus acidipiscis]
MPAGSQKDAQNQQLQMQRQQAAVQIAQLKEGQEQWQRSSQALRSGQKRLAKTEDKLNQQDKQVNK